MLWIDIVGYPIKACTDSFFGVSIRAMEEEVTRKIDMYVSMLLQSAEACENDGVITLSFSLSKYINRSFLLQ